MYRVEINPFDKKLKAWERIMFIFHSSYYKLCFLTLNRLSGLRDLNIQTYV